MAAEHSVNKDSKLRIEARQDILLNINSFSHVVPQPELIRVHPWIRELFSSHPILNLPLASLLN